MSSLSLAGVLDLSDDPLQAQTDRFWPLYPGDLDTLAEEEMSAFNYIDMNATFRFMGAHRLVVGVNNIFDKEPPLLGGSLVTNGNTAAGVYDTLGRFLFVNLTLGW